MSREPLVVRWYRRILSLYPSALRARHGEEMVEVVRLRWTEAGDRGAGARMRFVVRTLAGAVAQAGAAWVDVGLRTARRRRFGRGDGLAAVDGLLRDLHHAVRSLARSPGFTGVAVLTLALGIGANTAIYSIVEAVLLESLPYPAADRLLVMDDYPWTPSDIPVALEASAVDVEVVGFYPRAFTLTDGDEPEELEGARVTPGFFSVLGAGVALGRPFLPADARPDAPRTALVSHGLWQRRWGGRPDVLERTVRIDGEVHRIVGVLEEDFRQLTPRADDPRLWVPVPLEPNEPWGAFTSSSSTSNWTIPIVRVAPEVPMERVQAELDRVMERFREVNPELPPGPRWELRLTPLKTRIVRDVRGALLVLQLAVGVVLLLACVNVANLFLVRSSSRRRELAVRGALGASRGQLLRHLLAESLVISLSGGVVAVLIAAVGLDLLLGLVPEEIPRLGAVSVDASVLLVTLGVAVGTGLLFGLLPAGASLGREPGGELGAGGRSSTGGPRPHGLSRGLVVAEVSLTLILLVTAGLLARTFLSLTDQEPGFRTRDVVAVPFQVSEDRYGSVPLLEDFQRRLRLRVAAIPGVEEAAVSNRLPIDRGGSTREYVAEGRDEAEPPVAQYGIVSPGYFRALDIPLLRGRYLDERDRNGGPRAVVVDEALWRATWPGENPVGKRMRFPDDEEWMTVVGVVADIRGSGLDRPPEPGFYVSYRQRPRTPTALATGRNAVLLVRSGLDVGALAAPLREAVWEVDPAQPVPEVVALEQVLTRRVAPERFRAALLGAFALVAVLLVVAGIYGVVAFLVAERTREFGIRVAVGATAGDIVGRVLRWGLGVVGGGVVLGLLGVAVASRFLASFLFGVTPADPLTLGASVAAVLVVALAACLVPARRATRVDPVAALRADGRGG